MIEAHYFVVATLIEPGIGVGEIDQARVLPWVDLHHPMQHLLGHIVVALFRVVQSELAPRKNIIQCQ